MKKSDIEQKYDELYEAANKLIQENSPCRIDSNGLCIRERFRFEMFGKYKENNCCGSPNINDLSGKKSCKFIGEKGCTVKSLECSIWFCGFIRQWYKGTDFLNDIEKIQNEALKYNLLDPRKPKEYTLEKIKIEDKISEFSIALRELASKYE